MYARRKCPKVRWIYIYEMNICHIPRCLRITLVTEWLIRATYRDSKTHLKQTTVLEKKVNNVIMNIFMTMEIHRKAFINVFLITDAISILIMKLFNKKRIEALFPLCTFQ